MNQKNPRDIALKLLIRLNKKDEFSENILDRTFKEYQEIDLRDRAFISNIVQGVIRWRLRLDWIIERMSEVQLKKINPIVQNILRIAIYQIIFLDRVPDSAAINEAVIQSKKTQPAYVVAFVNAILRNICRQKKRGIPYPDRYKDAEKFLSIYYSYPLWLVRKWVRELSFESTEALLDAGNRIPWTAVRVNLLKTEKKELLMHLSDNGIQAKPSGAPPECLIIDKFRGRLDNTNFYKDGLLQIQGQASQIISHLLNPSQGELILDLCSGAGIKSTHLAMLMGNTGKIIALDINHVKLIGVLENSGRLGARLIIPIQADASNNLCRLFRTRYFKKILLDVPCSGLGTISRHPDIKWRKKEKDIGRLSLLQRKLLEEATSLLDVNGLLLYVTCTISNEENEELIKNFLKTHTDFSLVDLSKIVPEWCSKYIDSEGFFRTYPHIHGMEGFFGALITRWRY